MPILVISDIHANLTALETILDDAGEYDSVWCLGDLVGYGPDPNECIQRVQELPGLKCVIGNHDAAALNRIDNMSFNAEARAALEWTKATLTQSSIAFLSELPETVVVDQVTMVHGSPRQPVWEYLMDANTATINFNHFSTPFCFVGHTHLPVIFRLNPEDAFSKLKIPEPNKQITLQTRTIINPGSVGQPRDNDPRASYALYDPNKNMWDYRRVEYDIPLVQVRMGKAGLPTRHIIRLENGW
jgi:predicted phosphodiesterase